MAPLVTWKASDDHQAVFEGRKVDLSLPLFWWSEKDFTIGMSPVLCQSLKVWYKKVWYTAKDAGVQQTFVSWVLWDTLLMFSHYGDTIIQIALRFPLKALAVCAYHFQVTGLKCQAHLHHMLCVNIQHSRLLSFLCSICNIRVDGNDETSVKQEGIKMSFWKYRLCLTSRSPAFCPSTPPVSANLLWSTSISVSL